MRIAAGAALVLIAMFAISLRGEELKNGDDPINWEGKRDPFACQFVWVPVVPPPPPKKPDDIDITKARDQLNNLYAQSENAMLEGDAITSLKLVDQGLDLFRAFPDKMVTALSVERELLTRLRTAADRMYQRDNAERDFAQLNLSLTGVVQSKQARAILNSKVVGRGEVIAVPNSSQIVVVTDIQHDKVIVRFRGFLMAINLVDSKG